MRKIEKGEVARAVLASIGVVGIVAVGVTCPGLFALVPKEHSRRYSRKTFTQAARRLRGDYYTAVKQGDAWKFYLTEKGRALLDAYALGQKTIKPQPKWDGKWHVLIFDIPETARSKRDCVRRTLIEMGFHRLQDSVWVFPYECRQIMNLLRIRHQVIREALYLVVESLDGDHWLRKQYHLPLKLR